MSYYISPAAQLSIRVLYGGVNTLIHTKNPQKHTKWVEIALYMRL